MPTLFDPIDIGEIQLPNRVVMAPMTRSRATDKGVPTELMATYYAQRASAGLIISEGIQPNIVGQGYPNTPGLHSDQQIQGWTKVTEAVHAKGGHIIAQIMHAGRIGHPSLHQDSSIPVAPSAIKAAGQVFTPQGLQDMVVPTELDANGIQSTIADFVSAAKNAIEAGFDGIELHGANGYLLQQFLADNTNHRTDQYGGSIQGRIRFVVEVSQAVAKAIGSKRVGIRISPEGTFNDIAEKDPLNLYLALTEALSSLDLAYLHVIESKNAEITKKIRSIWPGHLIINPSPLLQAGEAADSQKAQNWLDKGADLISFGRMFLANPDFVERLKAGFSLNEPDMTTAYGGDETGYTDYPFYSSAQG